MIYEIITFRYGKKKSMVVWNLTEPNALARLHRYFEKNKSLGYQYDVIGRTPVIRFGSDFDITCLGLSREWYTCATTGERFLFSESD
jgi:hypothetical protein